MAEVKKKIKKLKHKNIKKKVALSWFENKIQRIRALIKPQAPRFAKKWGRTAGLTLILFLTLYSFFLPKNNFQKAKERVLKNPKDFEAHLILAEEFLKNNQLELAEKELLAAKNIQENAKNSENKQVLGLTSKFEELYLRWQEENPEELEKLIKKWEKIVSETPTYRDGYLYLALYYFKLGNRKRAQENLTKAREIDPDYKTITELEEIIK